MLALVILATLALQYAAAAEEAAQVEAAAKSMEGKSAGNGYGYGNNDGYGHNGGYGNGNSASSYGNSYLGGYQSYGGYGNRQRSSGHGHGHSGHGQSGHGQSGHGQSGHGYSHQEKQTPIEIPYLDRNGCSFPGDIVCDAAATDGTTYSFCVLSAESKNLWKKPSMEVVAATCSPVGAVVLSDWCNDNERLLRAVGFIKEKKHNVYNHQRKYAVSLQPCILVAPA